MDYYGQYKPKVKFFMAFSAKDLTDKVNNFIDELCDKGFDPEMIYMADISTSRGDRDYILATSVKYYERIKKNESLRNN